ncbi:MAG: energy-coupling factor transporter ATPase [Ruminococcaceae bacterium]|nr:energy-coupling factor transporter ATPase [Oscillospiraceae bacterium]
MSILEVRGVSFSYKGSAAGKCALKDIDLSFQDNMITGLIGHTGSGKSTLVQMFNGLLKPDSGQILLDGKDIWSDEVKIRDVRFRVGLVMQYPEYQLFAETVEADIAYGPGNMGMSDDEISDAVIKSAGFVNLDPSQLKKSPFDLSGGQKRRAALAGVIAMGPEILVLDEPAAGLDPAGRREILGKIKEYQRASGTTVIIVSHSMEDMAMYCDRVAVLAQGRLMFEGTTPEVFSRYDELVRVGLDVPEITRLAARLDEEGIGIGRDVYTVKYAYEKFTEFLKESKGGGKNE